jgi:glutathione synthase/RimK-type ligase-like ATP-grasp enzyme
MVGTDDPTPPSDAKAIQKFIKAAEKIGFSTEIISKNDYGKLTQFDALFIRETTNVNHHTYRFSRKARAEGLAVIDDPVSIMKCTNKVYLNELMIANKIPVPNSFIVRKGQKTSEFKDLTFPLVLKIPDGSFSKGVKKVSSFKEFETMIREYFKSTDLVIAQEFMPTEFDWRVGVLNGKPLYLCKYYMARNHWQIVDWQDGKSSNRLGKSETIPIDEAPHGLIQVALRAANLIGRSLYGVDIKQIGKKFYVIEVNDNPSIESGIEDKVEKSRLYESLMKHLLNQVQYKSEVNILKCQHAFTCSRSTG